MSTTKNDRLVIAISSRALFDLSESHHVFTEQGAQAYHQYQVAHENEILKPGVAFALTKKLLALNTQEYRPVEVILLSRNSAETGLRVFNSINHYQLDIARAAFTRGAPTSRYVAAFGAHLFLSADSEDVQRVLADGYAAATIFPGAGQSTGDDSHELRIAFDGDAVLFSDESERVHQQHGLDAFTAHEQANAHTPMSGGPFKEFLAALHRIQNSYPEDKLPIRTALLTARAVPAHERVVRTLRDWDIRIDEAFFLGGLDKTEFLKMFGADIFFDDQLTHCEAAAPHVATGHVPHGIKNEISTPQIATPPVATPPQPMQPNLDVHHRITTLPPIQSPQPAQPIFELAPQTLTSTNEDPLLVQTFTPQTSSTMPEPTHHMSAHSETMPIVDGTPPTPSVSHTTEQGSQEKVWLFDETPSGAHADAPTLQPVPLPTPGPVAQAPVEEKEPEAALSTEEILRRFARKMTEGTQQHNTQRSNTSTSAPSTPSNNPSTPPSTPPATSNNSPFNSMPAATPAPVQQPPQNTFSNNDVFQNMAIEEVSYEAINHSNPTNFFEDDPLLQPRSNPAVNKPVQPQPVNPVSNTDSSSRPSVPNPFALMKDFNE